MASGKFRVVLLLIGVMASSLLMEDIRSKVWQFVQGTSHFKKKLITITRIRCVADCVFNECLFTHCPYLTYNIIFFFHSLSKVDLMQSAIKIGKQVNSCRP